jgi:hypothetical protein
MLTDNSRTFSRDSSADRTQANTMPKMVYQKPLQAITNATPTVDQVSFLTPNTTPSFTKSSSQTTGDLDTPHWGEEMDEGAGSDLSRYVQHHVSVDFYRGSMPFEPDPTWQDLSTVSRIVIFKLRVSPKFLSLCLRQQIHLLWNFLISQHYLHIRPTYGWRLRSMDQNPWSPAK